MHRLTKAQALRIAVRAQLLDAPRPTELLTVVQKLTLLQIDPTAAVAPSADLVAWSRLGSAYQPAHLQQALEQDRTLFEHNALVRPMGDLALYLAGVADWPSHERPRVWLRDNDRLRRDSLDLLGSSGPVTSRDIPDTCVAEGVATGHLVTIRSFQLARPDFQLIVEFGSAGAASRLLAEVNRVLASVVVAESP